MFKPDWGKVEPTFLDKLTMAACVENTSNCHLVWFLSFTLQKSCSASLQNLFWEQVVITEFTISHLVVSSGQKLDVHLPHVAPWSPKCSASEDPNQVPLRESSYEFVCHDPELLDWHMHRKLISIFFKSGFYICLKIFQHFLTAALLRVSCNHWCSSNQINIHKVCQVPGVHPLHWQIYNTCW
jgi:hypothetical protein